MNADIVLKPGLVRRIPLAPHELKASVTPQRDLFVLAHIGIPQINKNAWSLKVDGAVERPLTLKFDDLLRLPKITIEAFHQCAGFPRRPDLPTRRVANVVWGGVAVREVLERVGVKNNARFLWAFGLDQGDFEGKQERYAKDLPLEQLEHGDWLLAYEVNGEPLAPAHGYPVRLIAPGFYGTNSVKWLSRLVLADERCPGTFTQVLYNDPGKDGKLRPVWNTEPESVIVAPAKGAEIALGRNELWGWAWGRHPIERVEVSCDDGSTWAPAVLASRRQWAWQRFSYGWDANRRGSCTLTARAFDAASNAQACSKARNAIHKVEVEVV